MNIKNIIIIFFLLKVVVYSQSENKCLDANGFTTSYSISSFNTIFPDGNHQVEMSFFEMGNTSLDLEGQRQRVDYLVVMPGGVSLIGSYWAFGKTNQFYELVNGECTLSQLEFTLPSSYPINDTKNIGTTKIGQFPTDIYILDEIASPVIQTILYDIKQCAMVSSIINNKDITNPGFATMNYLNFENSYTESWFDLPNECISQVNRVKSEYKSISNVHKLF
ncbi:hypothetical protein PPL_00929 [Heterostelium album PN500]|uniref:Uncharacterized protein n=1 Tax=Heterostelium pallidum (strain ATCC 26659 / Pp 5 / PN500) TaxID=670386 RepID=D3AXM3_HETP5|nr:hypothetical protein PPL_00929 [Heterostelium album PN500]EFA85700.1 hypothetical protein PPL_00929 [Heterostelium album PN500]|eukprot:XP_020437806.1 hypothetical protein PPL_00929 [Heterostelium album PN500]